jgi:hypothetical protein
MLSFARVTPEPALVQPVKKTVVVVPPVHQHDFPRLQVFPQILGLGGVILAPFADDKERCRETAKIQPQVDFGRRLPGTVFRPVDAIGAQLDDGGVDRMDLALEPVQRAVVTDAMGKSRGLPGKQIVDLPEQGVDEIRIPVLVGIGQGVFPQGMDGEPLEDARLQLEPVAQVGEADYTVQLGKKHRSDMAHRGESPGLLVDALFFGDPLEQILGNWLAEFLENCGIGLGCFWDHTLGLPQARGVEGSPIFNHYGMLVDW